MGAWDWVTKAIENIDLSDIIDVGTAVGGGIINNNAVDKATQAQDEAAKKALELQERMYNQSRQDLAPYRETGNAANKRLSQLMGLDVFDRSGIADGLKQNYKALFGARPADATVASSEVAPSASTLTPEQVKTVSGYEGLPGWDEGSQSYFNGMQYIPGEAGKRAAENAALSAKTRDLTQRSFGSGNPDYSGGLQFHNMADQFSAPLYRDENEWTNQELVDMGVSPEDATYNRGKSISSLIMGDIPGMQEQAYRSRYTAKQGLLKKLSPYLKIAGTAAVLGPGAAAIAGPAGLGLSGLPATLAEKAITTVGGRAFNG